MRLALVEAAGQDHDGQIRLTAAVPHPADDILAAASRQLEVENCEIDILGRQHVERLLSVGGS